jgi:hypothetical protein
VRARRLFFTPWQSWSFARGCHAGQCLRLVRALPIAPTPTARRAPPGMSADDRVPLRRLVALGRTHERTRVSENRMTRESRCDFVCARLLLLAGRRIRAGHGLVNEERRERKVIPAMHAGMPERIITEGTNASEKQRWRHSGPLRPTTPTQLPTQLPYPPTRPASHSPKIWNSGNAMISSELSGLC